jgi:hypothetical protein
MAAEIKAWCCTSAPPPLHPTTHHGVSLQCDRQELAVMAVAVSSCAKVFPSYAPHLTVAAIVLLACQGLQSQPRHLVNPFCFVAHSQPCKKRGGGGGGRRLQAHACPVSMMQSRMHGVLHVTSALLHTPGQACTTAPQHPFFLNNPSQLQTQDQPIDLTTYIQPSTPCTCR